VRGLMGKRAERRARADKKREKFIEIIADRIQKVSAQKMERGFSPQAAFSDALAEADIQINDLISQFPESAHLIRQAAYQFKRGLEEVINEKRNNKR